MASSYVCRRLILLLDGTWNDAEEAGPATNIVYLRELLFWGLQRRFDRKLDADKADYAKLDDEHRRKAASGLIFDGFEYVVYYGRGVGTSGFVDRVKGGGHRSRPGHSPRLQIPELLVSPRRRNLHFRIFARRLHGAQPRRLPP